MKRIEIDGGYPLYGEVKVQGSKNAVLPMIAAAFLGRGTSVLRGCPRIIDVHYMAEILKSLGCKAKFEGNSLVVDAHTPTSFSIAPEYAGKMRSSIIMLGALIGRMGEARLAHPGGCVIGKRPIDIHLDALRQMHVEIEEEDGILCARTSGPAGADITFPSPSVGAAENAILAAVCGKGDTRLRGCACEPEITELCAFLNKMGARITGAGTSDIHIRGVERLHGAEYDVVPDRIVAGTYAAAALATRGAVTLTDPPAAYLAGLGGLIRKMGGVCELTKEALFIDGRNAVRPAPLLSTAPYPGFPTDLQSQFMAALSVAEGESVIRENIFEDRFKAVPELKKLGADIELLDGRTAVVRGVKSLAGTRVSARELRGGAALVIAGLAAKGHTSVEGKEFIDRGYADICADLKSLGGHIRQHGLC